MEDTIKIDESVSKTELVELIAQVRQLRADNEMLLQVADKKQLGQWYQRNAGKIPTQVKLRTMMVKKDSKDPNSLLVEKVVVGWQSTMDVPPQIDPATGRWTNEIQKCKLIFEDGEVSEEMFQVQFTRNYKQVTAEVKQKITDEETGNLAFKVVRLDNGREYTIGDRFIN